MERGGGQKWGCMASASRCVCLWRACMRLWSPRTCRLSAAGGGSQLSGELRERGREGRPGERRASGRRGLEPALAHSK